MFYITVNYATHKYFLKFSIDHLTADDSPTKLYLEFSSGDTVDLDMKEICRRRIPSKDFSNSNFLPSFSFSGK